MASLYKIVNTFLWQKIPNKIEAVLVNRNYCLQMKSFWSLMCGDWNSVLDYKTQSE